MIEFPCGKITLEGMMRIPEGAGPFPLVVVLSSPSSLRGQAMNNNVVDAVCASFGKKEIAWLKFNFRGVGRSGGVLGKGSGRRRTPRRRSARRGRSRVDPRRVGLCGYSFGRHRGFGDGRGRPQG